MGNFYFGAITDNLEHLSFDVYVSPPLALDINANELEVLKAYLANLAVEGVLCTRTNPPDAQEALAALDITDALAVPVTLVRSRGILAEFQNACQQLEEKAGPALNGHAPTVFAASRIAQSIDKTLSTILHHGGLNFLVVNDILERQKQGRGDTRNDPPRPIEAEKLMQKKPKHSVGVPTGALRKALSDAEFSVLKAEIVALEQDIAEGRVPSLSHDEAVAALGQSMS